MISTLTQSADFERVLRTRRQASSAHFAVHHVSDRPHRVTRKSITVDAKDRPAPADLSTDSVGFVPSPVDDLPKTPVSEVWLGTVVPKRHAKRAVTRTLLKRQIRVAMKHRAPLLAGGLWVVRLRAPLDRARFVSAASEELQRVVRDELDALLDHVVRPGVAGV